MRSQGFQKGVILSFSIPYGNFYNYSPRGISDKSVTSQKIVARVKAGKIDTIDTLINLYLERFPDHLNEILNPNCTLVPIPRSSPLVEGASWPSLIIAEELVKKGLGKEVVPVIERKVAIRKSHGSYNSETRPSVQDHLATLQIHPKMITTDTIVLVDDVITMGTISISCAKKIQTVYNDKQVKSFGLSKTLSFVSEIEEVLDPTVSSISSYDSGKVFRHD